MNSFSNASNSFDPTDASWVSQLLDPAASVAELEDQYAQLLRATSQTWNTILSVAARQVSAAGGAPAAAVARLTQAFVQWMHGQVQQAGDRPVCDERMLHEMAYFYEVLGQLQLPRHDLLTALAIDGSPAALHLLGDRFRNDPPRHAAAAAAPIAALFHARRAQPELLFPELLECLANPDLAPAVLDLANYLTRQGRVAPHPAHDRSTQLMHLLDGLVAGLESVQQQTHPGARFHRDTQYQLSNSISLAISICDALALIGDDRARASLERATQLQHRRLRVEALSALARLKDEQAAQELVELAAEPVVRLRVLAYAEELQLGAQVDERYKTPVAIAEAELVAFLGSPSKFGVFPSTCELIDTRTQYWPGYEEPQMCYLFRYTYRVMPTDSPTGESSTYSNIGIAGPLVQALQADLCDLPVDDIYAVYAGWHAEHEEIYQVDWNAATDSQRQSVQRWLDDLEHEDYEAIQPLFLASFFGDPVLVCRARLQGVEGTAIVDAQGITWHPHLQSGHALGSLEYYDLYQGRRLLRAFNPDEP